MARAPATATPVHMSSLLTMMILTFHFLGDGRARVIAEAIDKLAGRPAARSSDLRTRRQMQIFRPVLTVG
jgi:hypothetical protein